MNYIYFFYQLSCFSTYEFIQNCPTHEMSGNLTHFMLTAVLQDYLGWVMLLQGQKYIEGNNKSDVRYIFSTH